MGAGRETETWAGEQWNRRGFKIGGRMGGFWFVGTQWQQEASISNQTSMSVPDPSFLEL